MYKFVKEADKSYCEESQALPFRMILCEKDGDTVKALHDWIKCRDFVAEALFSELAGVPKSIYGFGWHDHYEKKPLTSQENLYVAVKGDLKALEKHFGLFQDFESMSGLCASELVTTDDEEVVIIESDSGWIKSPTLLNLYSLIVKCLMFGELPDSNSLRELMQRITETDKSLYSREKNYWDTILKPYGWTGVERIVSERNDLFALNWEGYKDVSTSELHHGHGPVAFFTAAKWVQDGTEEPSCCVAIKDSVVKFCKAAA